MDDSASRGRSPTVRADLRPFHKYLRERHADTVVLTFGQIEDLLGSPLPDEARVQTAWWTASRTDLTSPHAQAWMAANRTAVPNLLARTVRFERVAA